MSRIPWDELGHTERGMYDVGEDAERLTAMLETLGGQATGEIEVGEKRIERIEPFMPAVCCSIVSVLNERERLKDASAAEQVEPRVAGTVGARAGLDRKGGWGLKRLYHRFCGIH